MENSFVLPMVQNSFVLSMWVHGPSLVDVQRTCCHIEQLVQWPNLMLNGLVRWITSLSHHFKTQTGTDLWALSHFWNITSQLYELRCIYRNWTWSLIKISYFDVRRAFFVWISKGGIELFKKHQTRAMLDNKVLMSPTWAGLIGYRWGWRWMTKRTQLTKPRNFELVTSNLLGRLIHGFFGWNCVPETHPKESKFD
jgi:hypothetical protein